MQHRTTHWMMVLTACLLTACTAPWGGDVGCFNLASYVERVDCQTRGHRTISADEELRRKPSAAIEKAADAADPICYTKAGAGEKPCAK
jgi:hypothetical protein